jgi:hypothetical protein
MDNTVTCLALLAVKFSSARKMMVNVQMDVLITLLNDNAINAYLENMEHHATETVQIIVMRQAVAETWAIVLVAMTTLLERHVIDVLLAFLVHFVL